MHRHAFRILRHLRIPPFARLAASKLWEIPEQGGLGLNIDTDRLRLMYREGHPKPFTSCSTGRVAMRAWQNQPNGGDTVRTALRAFPKYHIFAAVLACASATGSFQSIAADDANAQGQVTKGSANSSVPDKSDSAEAAFKKLDRTGKGYVTLEDVAVLPGFASAFTNADSSHLGRLNLIGFKQAWTAYVGGRS